MKLKKYLKTFLISTGLFLTLNNNEIFAEAALNIQNNNSSNIYVCNTTCKQDFDLLNKNEDYVVINGKKYSKEEIVIPENSSLIDIQNLYKHVLKYLDKLEKKSIIHLDEILIDTSLSKEHKITTGDGCHYWFCQSTHKCNYDIIDEEFGRTSKILAGGKYGRKLSSCGCSIYSTAIALSNIANQEITPVDVIQNILGCEIKKHENNYYFETESTSINGIHITESVYSDKKVWANNINNAYQEIGIVGEYIENIRNQKYVDYILSKGGCIIISFNGGIDWCDEVSSGHFMVIRGKDENGLYYCYNSTSCGLYGGGDKGAITSMQKGITYKEILSNVRTSDAVAIYRK